MRRERIFGVGAVVFLFAACLLGVRGSYSGPGPDASGADADTGAMIDGWSDSAPLEAGEVERDASAEEERHLDGGCSNDPPWWNDEYRGRWFLEVASVVAVPAGYTVAFGVDHAALVREERSLSSGNDLRVVRWDDGRWSEITRRLVGVGTSQTTLWFKTVEPIMGEDASYFVYFENPAAVSPPAGWSDSMGADDLGSGVYLAADDFEEHETDDCPDGWDPCPTSMRVVVDGGRRFLDSRANGVYLLGGSPEWGDVLFEVTMESFTEDACWGIASRVESELDLVFGGYNCGRAAPNNLPWYNAAAWTRVSGSYAPILWGEVAPQGTVPHRIAMGWVGASLYLFHDGALVSSVVAPGDVAPAGRVGLFSSYGTGMRVDEVVVRRFVYPEPEVSIARSEEVCE